MMFRTQHDARLSYTLEKYKRIIQGTRGKYYELNFTMNNDWAIKLITQ